MHLLNSSGQPIELEFVGEVPTPRITAGAGLPGVSTSFGVPLAGTGVTNRAIAAAVSGVFGLRSDRIVRAAWSPVPVTRAEPPPAVFRERRSGLVRISHREIVIRFAPRTSRRRREQLLKQHGLEQRRANPLVPEQIVAVDRTHEGPELLELCNASVEDEDVVFATPNFVSEYRRQAPAPTPPPAQWHLVNRGLAPGQVAGEDVRARDAWLTTTGRPSIVVAVLDDGVDVDHPNLKARIWRNPDKARPDRHGRDFFLPDDHPDHHNPRPKQFTFPYDQMPGNDIHGTPCAGVIAAAGKGAFGVAPRTRVLPVKVFHADLLAEDERVADAVRYAAVNADILSCSWSGPRSTDLELALEDAQRLGRQGLGAAIFCASGNENGPVAYPASSTHTIAVGASTDGAVRASYSNSGPELDLVAPSSGGAEAIFTTDVSRPPGRGFNVGRPDRGGADGLHTDEFGGTSSATPLAAGVAALVLAVDPELTRDELRDLFTGTADKIGDGDPYGAGGRCDELGFGRVNAARAVAAAQDRRQERKERNPR